MKSGTYTVTRENIPLTIDWQWDPGDPSVGIGPGLELIDVRDREGRSLWDFLDCLGALETLRVMLLNHLLNHTQELDDDNDRYPEA